MKTGIIFEWFDMWVGLYYNKAKRRLYIFPLPMIGFYIERAKRWEVEDV